MEDTKLLPRPDLLTLSPDEFVRVMAISGLNAKLDSGMSLPDALAAVGSQGVTDLNGQAHTFTPGTLRRWYNAFRERHIDGLRTRPRRTAGIGACLPPALVKFVCDEKKVDRYASVPELIRRARARDLIDKEEDIDRTTLWRLCRAHHLPLGRVPGKLEADMRRWAYPHRMMMVLADGKHFRAGPRRHRRMAYVFLDDASRFGLGAVVGTSENALLFLRGLHKVIMRHGLMDSLYLDRGPGFRAQDVAMACVRLGINPVLGAARYPEGHGKIERFNQTFQAQLLRGFPGAADVDDDCASLELRVEHYLAHQYNRTPHESLS
jgi:transposase InsO family protein